MDGEKSVSDVCLYEFVAEKKIRDAAGRYGLLCIEYFSWLSRVKGRNNKRLFMKRYVGNLLFVKWCVYVHFCRLSKKTIVLSN